MDGNQVRNRNRQMSRVRLVISKLSLSSYKQRATLDKVKHKDKRFYTRPSHRTNTNVSITDCHAGNPCKMEMIKRLSHLTLQMIEDLNGMKLDGRARERSSQSNVLVIPSTRVSSSTDASRSKPKSNTKKNRILPAKIPTVKNSLNKVKQVWKVKGKLSANGLNKAKQVYDRPLVSWNSGCSKHMMGNRSKLKSIGKVPLGKPRSSSQVASVVDSIKPCSSAQRKVMLQCALSLKEEKSSCFRPFSSTSFIFFHARSDVE
ncbi:hypothetical protein Tco_0842466 [Tanacetum coccineum]|uniref:Uncharacterized protein n=1 Tax=Tanacetum coccineum TaxID=301880 RepID=A0ABQ5B4Z6_9ASTR